MNTITMILYIIPTLILAVVMTLTMFSWLKNLFSTKKKLKPSMDAKLYKEMDEDFCFPQEKEAKEMDKINCFVEGLLKNKTEKQFMKLLGIGYFSLSFYRKGFVLVEKIEQIDKVIQSLTMEQIKNIDFKVFVAEMQKTYDKKLAKS